MNITIRHLTKCARVGVLFNKMLKVTNAMLDMFEYTVQHQGRRTEYRFKRVLTPSGFGALIYDQNSLERLDNHLQDVGFGEDSVEYTTIKYLQAVSDRLDFVYRNYFANFNFNHTFTNSGNLLDRAVSSN